MAVAQPLLTATSVYSLAAVVALLLVAWLGSRALLPSSSTRTERLTFVWLAFDALIHFIFEGSFLSLSIGTTVFSSKGVFAELWKEYALADHRWGTADPTIVSLELLTVLIAGPLCCYILLQLIRGDPARHYWLIVLSTMELYGGWMTFCPDWLVGSPNLNTANPLHLYVYLLLMNLIWVFIPAWIMVDSYGVVARSLRSHGRAQTRKAE